MNPSENSELKSVSRRQVLKAGALAVTAAAAAPLVSGQSSRILAAEEKQSGPAVKNMHLSMCAYSMRDALTKGQMDLFGFIDMCAELNLPGTELTSYYFRKDIDNAYLHQLKRHAFKNGVTISGTSVGNNFCVPPGPERDKQIQTVKQWIDYAAEMFAPHIRIFSGNVPRGGDKQVAIGWAVDGIKAVLDYAGERGIMLGLENHGGVTARAADHLAICDAVGNHPWFGINLDMGNYQTNCYEELAMAAPRAINVHIKVEVVQNDGTKVPADLERLRDILVNAGFKGWVSLEYEAAGDPRVEIPLAIKKLQEIFKA